MDLREVKLPSGAVLKVQPTTFVQAKALNQELLKSLRTVPLTSTNEVGEMVKNLFTTGFSSPEIEKRIWDCFDRCLYNDHKITQDTFEPAEARQDYVVVCYEVAKENILPFVKSLLPEYKKAVEVLTAPQK